MVHKELPQSWWFDSHNRARPSPWLSSTLSELDDKIKQMLKLIDQDADSFAQRAEMYYKKRPILVDMLGDLYRTHRSLAEQHDLLKHGKSRGFAPSSSKQSGSQVLATGGNATMPRSSCSSGSSFYDSESEVDDPEQDEEHEEEEAPELETQQQQEQVKLMRAEIEKLKEQQQEQADLMCAKMERLKQENTELRKAAACENAALKAELAGKDEEKREVIRQLASSLDMMREENMTLRDHIRSSSKSSSSSSRAFDLKKVAKDLFSVWLFTAHCKPTGPIVAL